MKVRPSVRRSIYNANKKAYSSIIDSRIIIQISGERAYYSLQENEAIFKRNIHIFTFSKKLKNTFLLNAMLLAVEGYYAYQAKGIDVLYKKIKCYFRKKRISKNLDGTFEKKSAFCSLVLRYSW